MGITEVKATETPDPDAETNLALRIGIKKQPGATIDHTKVKILVEFYDTVGDKDVKLTDADVNYEWLTPKHDWTDAIPRCCRSVISARKQESGRQNHRCLKRLRRVRPGKKVETQEFLSQIAESENIWDTGFEFITTINCRPFRPNLRDFYSFFLRPRTARHHEA